MTLSSPQNVSMSHVSPCLCSSRWREPVGFSTSCRVPCGTSPYAWFQQSSVTGLHGVWEMFEEHVNQQEFCATKMLPAVFLKRSPFRNVCVATKVVCLIHWLLRMFMMCSGQKASRMFPLTFSCLPTGFHFCRLLQLEGLRWSQNQSHFMADRQSVCLGIEPTLWTFDQIFLDIWYWLIFLDHR
jgi:hypothetical protein